MGKQIKIESMNQLENIMNQEEIVILFFDAKT